MMKDGILLAPILLPAVMAVFVLILPNRFPRVREFFSFLTLVLNLVLAFSLKGKFFEISFPWAGFGIDFSLRLYSLGSMILLIIASLGLLTSIYSFSFMSGKPNLRQFYAGFLLTIALGNGIVLADNLVLLLFFWEGMILTSFLMIFIGSSDGYKAAIKSLVISGVAGFLLIFGTGLTSFMGKTLSISALSLEPLSLEGMGGVAFFLLMVGAIGKAGSMPFHTWIPDASTDAPVPFMALVPAAIDKLAGFYFLSLIYFDLFKNGSGSWVNTFLMVAGAVSIILAAMMAVTQRDLKRSLSYHCACQTGYILLGFGTGMNSGQIGGLFHMFNCAIFLPCLFLVSGVVEMSAGTANLLQLGGLNKRMPLTFGAFIIAAVSICGVPPFNGFHSKMLIFEGAMAVHWVYFAIALFGSFLTAVSFLQLGHAVFLGKPAENGKEKAEESRSFSKIFAFFASFWGTTPFLMSVPAGVLSFACLVFGLMGFAPIETFLEPVLGDGRLNGIHFSDFPRNSVTIGISLFVLLLAILNHLYRIGKVIKPAEVVDFILFAPILKQTYDLAERRFFDPYDICLDILNDFAQVLWSIDRAIDWTYEVILKFLKGLKEFRQNKPGGRS